jgi:hypothetical protein
VDGPKGSFHNKNEWETKLAQPGKLLEYNASRGQARANRRRPPCRGTWSTWRWVAPRSCAKYRHQHGDDRPAHAGRRRRHGDAEEGGDDVLAPIFDNYRRAKLEVGKVLLCYMQTYISPGRRLRVLGDNKAGWVEATIEMTEGRFDLKVEETNASINDRMETLTVMQTTLPQIIQAGVPVPPEFIDLLPMNPTIRDEWKRMLPGT